MATTIQYTSLIAAIAGVLFMSGGLTHLPAEPPAQTAGTAELFRAFNQAVARHVELHAQLRFEIPGPVAKSSAAELSAASHLLAGAIRRARPRARQGDFFDASSARLIRQRLGDEVRSSTSTVSITSIDDEQRPFRHPRIYASFPVAAEMATMPSTLLQLLPTLPDELEYRIVGEYLVLRDVKAALVLDYIPGAIPRNRRSKP